MRISTYLYAGPLAAPRRSEILDKLQRGGALPLVYVLTGSLQVGELIDIYSVGEFRRNFVQRENPLVIGIAIGKKESFQVAKTIITELYERNGAVNIDASFDTGNT